MNKYFLINNVTANSTHMNSCIFNNILIIIDINSTEFAISDCIISDDWTVICNNLCTVY